MRRCFSFTVGCSGLLVCLNAVAQSNWNLTGGGDWNTAGNWNPAAVPTAIGATVIFGSKITADSTVTISAGVTAGSLSFDDDNNYTIDSATRTLTLDVSSGSASITANNASGNGVHTISGKLVLNDSVVVQNNSSGILTISAVISEGASGKTFTKSGAGTVALSGANTYSGVTRIDSGVLRLNSGGALPGGIGTMVGSPSSALTLNGGVVGLGVADFTRGLGTLSSQVQFTGDGGFAAYSANRTVNLGGNNTTPLSVSWGVGSFVPNGSSLKLSSSDSDATLDFRNPIGLGTLARTVEVADGTASVDAVLSGAITSAGSSGLIKTGAGTLRLSSAGNTYSGTTEIRDGAVQIGGGNNRLPTTTSLTLGNGSGSGKLILGDGTARNQQLAGLITDGAGTANAVVGGAASASTLTLNIASGSSSYDGKVGGTALNENNIAITKTGTGMLVLAHANTYTGGTTLNQGTLQLGANDALGTGGITFAAGTLDSQSFSASVGALSLTGGATIQLKAGDLTRGVLTFASATATGSPQLQIKGWVGTGGASGTAAANEDQIFITADPGSFPANDVMFISINGIAGNDSVGFWRSDTHELVPLSAVPEPSTILVGGLLACLSGWIERKNLRLLFV